MRFFSSEIDELQLIKYKIYLKNFENFDLFTEIMFFNTEILYYKRDPLKKEVLNLLIKRIILQLDISEINELDNEFLSLKDKMNSNNNLNRDAIKFCNNLIIFKPTLKYLGVTVTEIQKRKVFKYIKLKSSNN